MSDGRTIRDVLRTHSDAILNEWVDLQVKHLTSRLALVSVEQLRAQSAELLATLGAGLESGDGNADVDAAGWMPARAVLTRVAAERARQGYTPRETATFVMSLKQPLFGAIRQRLSGDALAAETWVISTLLDQLALLTTEVYQKNREDVIVRQQSEMLELSTPVITLWKGILALPLIGTLDSERTQSVMENLLQRIVDSGSTIAILDITGVPTVDTLVAQHLLKTVAAARLMGADCIISGVRPQIAQTIVHLGIDLNAVTTKATLADAFAVALSRLNLAVVRRPAAAAPATREA